MTTVWKIGLAGMAAALISCGQSAPDSGKVLTFQMRQGQPHPWHSTQYPEDQVIRPAAAGNWTAKLTGSLATGCYTWKAACLKVKASANGEAVISFAGSGAETLAAGVHEGVIEIGAERWVVRLNVLRRRPYTEFAYREGYPKGCRNSNPQMPHADTCTITNEAPQETFTELPSVGTQFVDPQFGSPVHRLTGAGFNVNYSATSAFSATGRYILTTDQEGFLQVWNRNGGGQAGRRFNGFNIGRAVWDPNRDERLWFVEGPRVGYRNIQTGQNTIVANYGSQRGSRPPFENLDTGGTADNTDDNWWVFSEEKQQQVCALDLNELSPSNQEEHLYCVTYSGLGIESVDFPQVTQIDSESGKRYVLVLAKPNAKVFSVDTENHRLKFEFEMPGGLSTPHSDVGQDSAGRQVLFWKWYDRHGDKYYLATGALNKGVKMLRPVEEGGGLTLIYPLDTGEQKRTDTHFGCNWRGYCVASSYQDPAPQTNGIPSKSIETVRTGSQCLVRTAANHGFRTGQSVVIGGALAIANGASRIQVIDDRSILLEKPCSGSFEAGTAHVAEARRWSPDSPNRDEVVVVRLNGEARRVAIHRSKLWADEGTLSAYWSTPRASISRDGSLVAFSSNLGLPQQNSVFWAEVDLTKEIRNAGIVERLEDRALLRWEGADAVTLLVSPDMDLKDIVYSYRHFAGERMERWIEGLLPDSQYFYQLLGSNSFWLDSFRTLAQAPAAAK